VVVNSRKKKVIHTLKIIIHYDVQHGEKRIADSAVINKIQLPGLGNENGRYPKLKEAGWNNK